jgi:hypothetical protein
MDRPPCIRCGSRKDVGEAGERRWFCHGCKVLFDEDPDEGGDYSTGDPSRRMEREERRART